jgi:lipoprotein-anchoring transpeptidase ErfK/SrfK
MDKVEMVVVRRCIHALFALACFAAAGAHAGELSMNAVNAAGFADKPSGDAPSPAIIKAQVLLDRAAFSPGVIDGMMGDNVRKALAAFQREKGLEESGRIDRQTWDKLVATSEEPILTEHEITKKDVDGPFVDSIPAQMEKQKELERLSYTGPRELLAEKFHMDEDLLQALNRGKSFEQPRTVIVVAKVGERKNARAAKVIVDKKRRSVEAVDKNGDLIAFFPATIGSDRNPAPDGTYEVRRIAKNPTYHYSPELDFKGVKSKTKFTIAAGPNNPVGKVWIDLSKESYGIHGTPEPAKISKTFSHGCIRLTNWDALALAEMVRKGTPVEFVNSGPVTGASRK